MTDQNRKSLRSFQCRDYLWEIFGQMSSELECSVDYLINEAMRQYARSRNYGVRGSQPSVRPSYGGGLPPASGPSSAPSIPSLGGSPARPPLPSAPPPPPPRPSYGAYPGAPAPGAYQGGSPAPFSGAPPAFPPQQGPGSQPPPLPGAPAAAPGYGARPTLSVIFNGQKIPVTKDEFVIGRGSKTADLPIKDGNISRRHAAIVFQGGAFYVKDLGSTNGIEHNGRRIDSKRVEEGDIVQICDYELRFTYH
ncbi:MAG: FHA domain-containing protein [Myxococcota bacterium]